MRFSSDRSRRRYVKVAANSGRPTYLTFSYSVPADRPITPGEVVHAPFGRRMLQGIVVEGPLDTPGYDPDQVRPLEAPVEGAPVIPPERMALAAWLQHYYIAPPWEAHALFLPPGAAERPRTTIVRAPESDPEPGALSEHQTAMLERLSDRPVEVDDLKSRLQPRVPARAFDAALEVLLRRGLAERRYRLDPPRAGPRVVEWVRLLVEPGAARAFADAIEGQRISRRAKAIRAVHAVDGAAPHAEVARAAGGRPAVETLIREGIFARDGDLVRLQVDDAEVTRLLRVYSRSRAAQAAAALLERLAALAERGDEPVLRMRGLAGEIGEEARAGVQRMVEANMVAIEETFERRDPLRDLTVMVRPSPELVGEQRAAAQAIRAALNRGDGTELLLQGVTGSGKTEVYLDALDYAVSRGQRALVLVPEIALTPQTVRRFAERFPGRVGVLHSGLTLGEAFDEWHEIASGSYDVVIGSRSAIFAPQPDLGLIVIDEAHEWTYKQHDPAPRYDARTVAAEIARRTGATVISGTATPSVEQWAAAAEGRLERLELPRRIRTVPDPEGGTRLWPSATRPEVEVVDMRDSSALFSGALVEALGQALDRDEQAILFLNRRGLAGYLLCARGHSPMCSSCDMSLSLHEGNRLICHLCGRRRSLPEQCLQSGCDRPLRPARAGTQRVEQEVRRHFPAARILRWDRDTARTADHHEAIMQAFLRHEADVLVGTQMVAKGLDLPLVTLVGVVLADYTLREADIRARERAFQLLVQVSGRAGRADRDGRVIVQTLQPDEPAIEAAQHHDLDRFYESELDGRVTFGHPPYRRLVRLIFTHRGQAYASEEAARVAAELRRLAAGRAGIDVLGPTPPQVARVQGHHRWAILVRGPLTGEGPADLVREFDDLPPGWTVDVDPLRLS